MKSHLKNSIQEMEAGRYQPEETESEPTMVGLGKPKPI